MTFAEWQAQQGGGAGAPSPGGAPSFADWQAQQGGGSPAGAAPPPAQGGDASYYYNPGIDPTTGYDKPIDPAAYDTWSKAQPKSEKYGGVENFRPYDAPSGKAAGGWTMRNKDEWYDDPKYGKITPLSNLVDPSYEKDWRDYVGPLAMSIVLGGAGLAAGAAEGAAAAGAGGGAAGAGSGVAGTGTLAGAQGAALSGAQAAQGVLRNPNSVGGAVGGAIGGYSGIPGGSTVGSMAGNYLYNSARNRPTTFNPTSAAIGAAPSFAMWLASQGGK